MARSIVRYFHADSGLAGNAIDADRFRFKRQTQIVAEAGDPRVLHARFRLEFECRDDRARVNLLDRADRLRIPRFLFDKPRSFAQFVFVDCESGGRCAQERRGGKLVGFGLPHFTFARGRDFGRAHGVTGATTGSIRDGEALGFAAVSSTRFGLSVMIVCFLGVFSFLTSGCCAARARSTFHSAQRSEMVEMKWNRGFRNCATQANENVVLRSSETRKLVIRMTTVPGALKDPSSLSAIIFPMRPPAGTCPRTNGTTGNKEKAAHSVKVIKIIPAIRTPTFLTGREASQQNA